MAIQQRHRHGGIKIGATAIRLNVIITGIALVLAAVAAQSPFL